MIARGNVYISSCSFLLRVFQGCLLDDLRCSCCRLCRKLWNCRITSAFLTKSRHLQRLWLEISQNLVVSHPKRLLLLCHLIAGPPRPRYVLCVIQLQDCDVVVPGDIKWQLAYFRLLMLAPCFFYEQNFREASGSRRGLGLGLPHGAGCDRHWATLCGHRGRWHRLLGRRF